MSKVLVGNLDDRVQQKHLEDDFGQFGPIRRLLQGRMNGAELSQCSKGDRKVKEYGCGERDYLHGGPGDKMRFECTLQGDIDCVWGPVIGRRQSPNPHYNRPSPTYVRR
ncbi:serine/arginine-rich splicing factor RSZ21-like [Carex rostrata]